MNNYQRSKKNSLQELLGQYCANIDWIWIGDHSRRRVTFQIDQKNRLGFFAEKTHNLIEINKDDSAEEKISALISPLKNFLKTQEENFYTQVCATLFDNGLDVVFTVKREPNFAQIQQLISFAKSNDLNVSYRQKDVAIPVLLIRKNQIFFQDFKVDLNSDIFLQATKSGLGSIIKIIRTHALFEKEGGTRSVTGDFIDTNSEFLSPKSPGAARHPLLQRGLRVVDIYAGFGAYSFAIYDLAKLVSAFEGSKEMIDLLNKNAVANGISNRIKGFTRDIFSSPLTAKELKDFDFVIINPPRNGASPQVVEISKSAIKNLIYVSCNPQSFKRDAQILIGAGFKIKNLTAIDQFYATKHLELVATFEK